MAEAKKTTGKTAAETVKVAAEQAAETVKVAAEQAAETGKKATKKAAATGKKAAETVMVAAEQAAGKARKAVEELKPEIMVQYGGAEVDVLRLAETARADFKQAKKRTPIRSFRLYVKPEDQAAYYVINDSFEGKIEF